MARITGKNIPEKMGFDVTVYVYSIRYLVTLYLRVFKTAPNFPEVKLV